MTSSLRSGSHGVAMPTGSRPSRRATTSPVVGESTSASVPENTTRCSCTRIGSLTCADMLSSDTTVGLVRADHAGLISEVGVRAAVTDCAESSVAFSAGAASVCGSVLTAASASSATASAATPSSTSSDPASASVATASLSVGQAGSTTGARRGASFSESGP